MFFSAHKKLSSKLSFADNWGIQVKLVLLGFVIILLAIPFTVVSTLSFRNIFTKASGTYGDCTGFGCIGPNLGSPTWSTPTYRVRYKCCFSSNWIPSNTTWANAGTLTAYAAPDNLASGVFDWEVQINIKGTWYNWQKGNLNGTSKSFKWTKPTYRAQLTHDNEFINACYKGTGGNNGQLSSCSDFKTTSSTSTTFTGLSPSEYYDLYVSIKDGGVDSRPNSGTDRSYVIYDHLGPTGACTNCPIVTPPPPPPTTTPPSKPVITEVAFLPTCLYSGQAYGSTLVYKWSGSNASKYAVDISEWSNFSPGFTNNVTTGTSFQVLGGSGWQNQYYSVLANSNGSITMQINKTYYMRVYAENSAGSVYSDIKSIFVPICGQKPVIDDTSLTTGLSTFITCVADGSTYGPSVKFSWSGSFADKYAVYIGSDSGFSTGFSYKVIYVTTTGNSFSATGSGGWINDGTANFAVGGNLNLLPGKNYYWRVSANSSQGGIFSKTVTLFMPACATLKPSTITTSGDSDYVSCLPAGQTNWGPTHAFSWTGGWGANEMWIDVSETDSFTTYSNKQLSVGATNTTGSGGWNANSANLAINGSLNLAAGKTYYFRVFAKNNYGSLWSNTSAFGLRLCTFTPTPQTTDLPSPWRSNDIGSPVALGGSRFEIHLNNGTRTDYYTVSGGGTDIWGSSDQFRYTYMELNGDGSLAVDLSDQTNSNGWAKAGIMFRETADATSKNAFVAITPSNGINFQARSDTGGSTSHQYNSTIEGSTRPVRLMITRSGSSFSGYAYINGWQKIGEATISMNSKILIGFAVTAHSSSGLSQATFSKLSGGAYLGSVPTEGATTASVTKITCSADNQVATVTFSWNGSNLWGAQYYVDISTNQNPTDRWRQLNVTYQNTALIPVPKNGTSFVWGNIKPNMVHYWRIYSAHTRTYVPGKPFVPCQKQPAGSPATGYISTYFSPSGHRGLDIAMGAFNNPNQLLYSTMSGKVIAPLGGSGYGNSVDIYNPDVIIDGHHRSVITRHGHLSSIDQGIIVGRPIPFGTVLGVWGETGTVSNDGGTNAIHDHYEVLLGPIDQVNVPPSTSAFTVSTELSNPLNYNIELYPCSNGLCAYSSF